MASFRFVLAAALACALFVALAPSLALADTPANCTYAEFLGKWQVVLSEVQPRPMFPSLNCNKSFTPRSSFDLELQAPNIAKIAGSADVGNWTLIYNQGIEVRINSNFLFAFSAFDNAGTDLCSRSSVAYLHNDASQQWRCAYLSKRSSEEDSAEVQQARKEEVLSPAHVPKDVAALNAQLRAERVTDPERLSRKFTTDHAYLAAVNQAAKGMFTVKHYPELDGMSIGQLEKRRGTTLPSPTPQEMQVPVAAPVPKQRKRSHSRAAKLHAAAPAAIPDSFDWRNVSGVNYVSPVRDQGQCGSCYVFSSAGQLEARIRIASQLKQQPILSTQDVVSCSVYSQGCEGGFPYLIAGKYAHEYGFTEEASNPYMGGVDSACALNQTDVCNDRWKVSEYYYVGGYYGASNEARMQQEVLENGPISVSFMVYDDFMHYAGGVYTHKFAAELQLDDFNPFELTNHAVLLVGWGVTDDEAQTPYWIVKNSWSTRWGEEGYFRILRSSDQSGGGECAIQSITVAAIPILH